ncbi:iron-containing alcohol dehydrogenase [Dyadobacter sp. CY323]|uniref:iron-containing alcohol dehydrogenase n=1 Tax=Dyadobacter sp. CY323 TaxID=2907302 RepID=UPI001F30C83D|nr:iron-containing alcohol dehydrogenase [Dyadobacter sp. CY323]MCE6991828.1 iron-containing alcohol dehydrogenase [Dyadobacter sp. CY323]
MVAATFHEFNAPASVVTGAGVITQLAVYAQRFHAKKVLLVTDAYLVRTGLIANVSEALSAENIESFIFSGVQPDPTVRNVEAGLRIFRDSQADLIVAIGGGSPIDASKAIAVLANNDAPLSEYAGYHKIPNTGVPLIVIPTTAGTGSEATKVAVITDEERHVKMMILDRHLMPTIALIDFELTLSMPPALTAYVGVDTLTHGIEAYVSRKANRMTDPIALSCIGLVSRHLVSAWENPGDREAREGMSVAACQGGMAFTNSSVCLVHGMSRPLGALFHLAHGLSNAVLLPAVTRFSLPGSLSRYANVSRTMGLADSKDSDQNAAEKLIAGLESLNEKLKIPRLRHCLEMDEKEFWNVLDKMAKDALASGSPQNNPVVPSHDEIVKLYREAW